MFDFHSLPLTSDEARAARNYFGWPQAKAAEESGLQLHKIKRFEAGNYIPDSAFLHDLRAFFERRGYVFKDTREPGARAKETGLVFPEGVVGGAVDTRGSSDESRPVKTTFHHMRIGLQNEAEMGQVLDLIEANEAQLQELLHSPVESGFFGGLTDQAQARHAHALKVLAENGLLYARLFGRNVGGTPAADVLAGTKKPATHAELMHRTHADALMAAAGDADAVLRHNTRKPHESVLGAIFLS